MTQPLEQPKQISIEDAIGKTEIAIVDDDPGFSFMLSDYLLSYAQLKSEIFLSSNDFLKNYNANDKRKIILDYEFDEGPNGLIVLQKIKAMNPTAIVIIVSGQDDLEKAVETMREGATDYFLKTNKTVFANIISSLRKIDELEKNKWN